MNLEDLKRVDTIQQYLGSVLAQLMASGREDIDSIITNNVPGCYLGD